VRKHNRQRLTWEWAFIVLAALLIGWFWLTLRVTGRIRVFHGKRMPRWPRGVLVVSNHPSLYEPQVLIGLFLPWLLLNILKYTPLSTPDKANYFDKWFLRWAHRFFVAVARGDARAMVKAMAMMVRALRAKQNLILFPEGGRTGKGEGSFVVSPSGRFRMRAFKDGAGRVAVATGCIVVPVWVHGAEKVLPIGASFPRFWHSVEIRIGTPMQFVRMTNGSRARIKEAACAANDQIRDVMLALADERRIP
jgi:1-acyl-sn-glycerol-3-phosphate acyltransferase